MPLDLGLILAAAALLAATVVIVYTLSNLREWVRERVGVFRNRQIIAGALRDRLENGNFRVIPFIYDDGADVLLDNDAIETKTLDNEMEEKFAGEDAFILTAPYM